MNDILPLRGLGRRSKDSKLATQIVDQLEISEWPHHAAFISLINIAAAISTEMVNTSGTLTWLVWWLGWNP